VKLFHLLRELPCGDFFDGLRLGFFENAFFFQKIIDARSPDSFCSLVQLSVALPGQKTTWG